MVEAAVIANLCIYILTWNVGTHHPKDVSLQNALALNESSKCPQSSENIPDIYVIAFQEVSVKPQNQILNVFQDDQWILKIRNELYEHDYLKVASEQMQGILITLWARPKHIEHMDDIETKKTKTGFGGIWGNKGAVSIRMSLYGTGVTFVNSHLAAHDDKLKERVIDYNQILDNHHYETHNYRTIFDHDFVFWFGDLNFRLNGDDSAWDVRSAVENGQLDELYERDQLKQVREAGNAFSLLQEQKPTFPPTFKFIEGTQEYDLKRRPAWCDRILHRVQELKYPDIKLGVQQLSYASHPSYTMSDHKPVSAEFMYTIKSDITSIEHIHELTHGGASETPLATFKNGGSDTPLAHVIITN